MAGSYYAMATAAACFFLGGILSAQIVDHNCIDVNLIPTATLEKVRKELRVAYGHSANGSQIITGMQALRQDNPVKFNFTSSYRENKPDALSVWDNIPPGDLGDFKHCVWEENTIKLLDGPGRGRNMVVWAWGRQLSTATYREVEDYLRAMNRLEKKYPEVKFVYMTGSLDGTGPKGTLHERNEEIRDYCRKNHKLLFDFADIESFSPGGDTNFMPLFCNGKCDFSLNGKKYNWAQEWLARNSVAQMTMPPSAVNTHPLCALLKGRAFWWMLAVVAGWTPPEKGGNAFTPVAMAAAPVTGQKRASATTAVRRLYRFDRIQDYRPWVLFGSSASLIPEEGKGLLVPSGTPAVAMYRGLYCVTELEFKAQLVGGDNISWYLNTDWSNTVRPKLGLGGVAAESGCLLLVNGEAYKYHCPVRLGGREHRFQVVIRDNRVIWAIDRNIVAEREIPAALAERKGSMALGGWKSTVRFAGVYFQAK
ncbi:MAG: hypothetical protein PHQ27_05000 [Victivallales bacterium]|nr:hypothetical protein [Victivallales bacterium]